MKHTILLPSAIWQGYDPDAEALEPQLLAEDKRENIHMQTYVVTALSEGDDKLLVAVKIYRPDSGVGQTILIVPEYHRPPSRELIFDLAKSGFTVVVPDLSGVAHPPTIFPKAYEYGNFDKAGDHIKRVTPTAKETSQYLYTIIIKRMLAFIKQSLPLNPIGLVGLGDAVEVAMQAAGSGGKVGALACLNSAGYREYIRLNKYGGGKELVMDEERIAWLAGVASVAYAKYINVPTFIAIGTNSEKSDIDRVENLLALIPGDRTYTSFSPRTSDFLLPYTYRTFKLWLQKTLSGEAFPDCPRAMVRVNEEGKIYVDIDCDPSSMIEKVTVYYSYGEYNHEIRDWLKKEGISVSFNEFIATIEVSDPDAPLFVFAEVRYENGIALSSLPEYMELAGQPVKAKPIIKPSRIVFEPSNGKDVFVECYKGEVLMDYALEIVAPNSAKGISSKIGSLKTYHIDRHLNIPSESLLQVELFSSEPREVTITLQNKVEDGIKKYAAVINITDTKGFFIGNKLKASDFKDERMMPLAAWSNIRSIEINGGDIIIGNILFI
ncbi:MAG: hypothetical protein WC292_05705 [Clostridia bacterium]